MKRFLLLLMLPLLAITFNSCSDDDNDEPNYEQLIIGTWKVTHLNNEAWTFETTTYTFNADKTYTATGYFNHAGTYSLSGKTLTLTYVDGYDGTQYIYTAQIISTSDTDVTYTTSWDDEIGTVTMRLKRI